MIRDNNGRYVYENNTDNKKFPIDKIKEYPRFYSIKEYGFTSGDGGYYVYKNDKGDFIEMHTKERRTPNDEETKYYSTHLYIPTKLELKNACKDLFIKMFEYTASEKGKVFKDNRYSGKYSPILINLNILDTTSMNDSKITESEYEKSYLSLIYLYCDLKYHQKRINSIEITKAHIIFFAVIALILYVFK